MYHLVFRRCWNILNGAHERHYSGKIIVSVEYWCSQAIDSDYHLFRRYGPAVDTDLRQSCFESRMTCQRVRREWREIARHRPLKQAL